MSILVIVRHGQSVYNLENRFTGTIDIALSEKGIEEARQAGRKLQGYLFAQAFTSVLERAKHTLELILEELGETGIEIHTDKALNERNYGDLQGLNKDETRLKYGDDLFNTWRRSFTVAPPNGESLQNTASRVIPFYLSQIQPELTGDNKILIVAHGNSLRALIMYLENLSPEEIVVTEIATGVPRIYALDDNLKLLSVTNL